MSDRLVSIGPSPVPVVCIADFNKLKQSELELAWQITGPAASHNLAKGPIWSAIAAAYLEGLSHGYGIATRAKP